MSPLQKMASLAASFSLASSAFDSLGAGYKSGGYNLSKEISKEERAYRKKKKKIAKASRRKNRK
jgi:hypothetical protein